MILQILMHGLKKQLLVRLIIVGTKLMDDESFTDPIPSNKAEFVTLVTARADYQNRSKRDEANAVDLN